MASTEALQSPHLQGEAGEGECDEVLMERIRGGDPESLRKLLERYWQPLVGFAGSIVGHGDDAEDIAQETFVRVWRHRESWTPSGKATVYLYRITRNLALNAVRDRQSLSEREGRAGEAFFFTSSPRTPAENFESESVREEIEAAISALPARRREIFVLCRFHGLTHTEIAETLEISVQTVSNQITSALSHLRKVLGHHFGR